MTRLALLLLATPAFASGALHTDGPFLRDGAGGAVILRGVNVAGNSKVPPFEPVTDATQLDPLVHWGMNAVRLLFTWEAYEPQPGAYDAGYTDYYRRTVQAAGARGLHVIVDFHQDAYSRFCIGGCGEGFPEWALPPTVTPATPDNGAACANWGSRMMSDAALKTTWDSFYADTYGARTRWLAMIGSVATALASEPAVIGYDLLNEPGGDEQTQIGPLYADAALAIRAADPQAILFVEPSPVLTSAAKPTHLPKPAFDNFVYAPHFYDPVAFLIKAWNGDDESAAFAQMTGTASSWGVPMLVGEFGADASTEEVQGYMSAVHRQLNLALASATQWTYSPGATVTTKDGWDDEDFSVADGGGAPRGNFTQRPYARRVAGTPTQMTLLEEDSYDLQWENDPAAGPTELVLPWPRSTVHGDADVSCTFDGGVARCSAPTSGVKHVHVAQARGCGLTGAEALLILALVWRRRGR